MEEGDDASRKKVSVSKTREIWTMQSPDVSLQRKRGLGPKRLFTDEEQQMEMKVDERKDCSKLKVMNENTRRMLMDKNESKSAPLRSIFCLRDKSKLKEIEKKEDCFILDYVPDDFIHKISIANYNTNEVSVVAEKGQVACRDFPHSRHNCAKHPFSKTNHESYCPLCYCFVCDRVAPCRMWRGWHCHATNNEEWKLHREEKQLRRELRRLRRRANEARRGY